MDTAGNELRTVLELRQSRGQAAGLVTIHDTVVGATPAAFGAHATSRSLTIELARDLRTGSRPNLLVGAPHTAIVAGEFEAAGYQLVDTRAGFLALDGRSPRVLASLADTAATLPERTAVALRLLDDASAGFFLVVEQANTDKQGHANQLAPVIQAVLELDAAVEVALGWAGGRDDTLILVTADHETGGLECTIDAQHPAVAGTLPNCVFTTTSHTGVNVPVFAAGLGAAGVSGTLDNTELFRVLAGYGVARGAEAAL